MKFWHNECSYLIYGWLKFWIQVFSSFRDIINLLTCQLHQKINGYCKKVWVSKIKISTAFYKSGDSSEKFLFRSCLNGIQIIILHIKTLFLMFYFFLNCKNAQNSLIYPTVSWRPPPNSDHLPTATTILGSLFPCTSWTTAACRKRQQEGGRCTQVWLLLNNLNYQKHLSKKG